MRVLLVTNDYPPKPGGIQQYLASVVAHSTADVRVLGPDHPGAPDEAHLVRGHARWMLPTRRTRHWIEAQASEFGAEVIVFGAPTPLAQLGPSVSSRTGLPYVVMAHGAEVTIPGVIPGLRQILGRTFRKAALVLTVSEFTAGVVRRMGGRTVEVLGAGVDLDAFAPVDRPQHETITLACISRFVPRKGHLRVIAAAERLARRGHTVKVLIVGKGRQEGRIHAAAERASVPVRVEVDVPWERLPSLYATGDVFVMPCKSRWFGLEVEGLGIVFLEAAATGSPVIAGRSGGAPETVVPGVTGFLAESVPEIVEAVEAITPEMGEAARARVEREFSWASVGDRFDSFLAQVPR